MVPQGPAAPVETEGAQQPAQAQPPQQARRVTIPELPVFTPGAAMLNALTPGLAGMAGSAARLERAFKDFVQKDSLISHMEAALRKVPKDARAWFTKAEQLFELYKEPDPKAAHLMAAVFFYATQINFVSLDLEYLADGYVSAMKMAIEEAGDSGKWTAETIRDLEKQIKKEFEDYRKEAQTQVGEGNAIPLALRGSGGHGNFGR